MIESLVDQLGDKVSTNPYALAAHGRDENATPGQLPLAVVFATSVADVQATLAWARAAHIPVIPFGAGTSFEGHVVPQGPAISLDLMQMQTVHRIAPEDFLVEIEPGVTRVALNEALRHTGLFFPVDPGANASLGGMAATNASGTTTVKYGGMRQNVLALEVVLANGEVLQLGRAVRKTSSGYDLKDLFIGSGGTLGVITRLTVRVHPVPDHVHTLIVSFPDLTSAAQTAYGIMASALPVARLEIMDELSLRAVNQSLGRSYPERPTLFIEFHASTAASIAAEADLAREIATDAGASDIAQASGADERAALWEARHQAYWALTRLYPNQRYTITDTAVPLAQLVPLLDRAQALLREMNLPGGILGHVGDGNFHTAIATLPEDADRAKAYSDALVEYALSLGGTATGEHGIGIVKRRFLAAEHGPALRWMQQIKDLFDPDHILNPGKDI
jgi:D-lactate dehydrogenase (cytochrome)